MGINFKYRVIAASAIVLFAIATPQVLGQSFTLETYNQGIDYQVPASLFGNGVSTYDFNQDGWDDLSFCNNGQPARFYQNNNGALEEVILDTDYVIDGDSKQILWVDYDNDGDKDMFIANYLERIVLLRNDGDLSFTDVSEEAGFYDEDVCHFGSAWGDVDNDGDLDLYVCKYHNPDFFSGSQYRNHLYRNEGDGTFTELSQSVGVTNGVSASFQAIFYDYDLDGFQDIFVINDRLDQQNYLYRNNGDWTFSDVSVETGMDIYMDAMCIVPGDYDQDGDLDIYISNNIDNFLMENQGGSFINVANDYGVLGNGVSWGALWIDHDLDMDLDLFVSNVGNVGTIELLNAFYENLEVFFLEDYEEFGLTEDIHGTYTVAMGDFNNDGHPDFVEGNNFPSNCHVFFNAGTAEKHWVKISVEGTVSNRDGIGTWIRVYTGDVCQVQYTFAGENYLSQNSQRKMFGLKNYTVIDSVEVSWLSGISETYYNLPSDTAYHFIEGVAFQNEIISPSVNNVCFGDSVILDAGLYASYMWSTGDTTQTISVAEEGSYAVSVIHESGFSSTSDSVSVIIGPAFQYEVLTQDVLCYGESTGWASLTFPDELSVSNVTWDNGDSANLSDSLFAGSYHVEVMYFENCMDSLDIVINENDSIQILALVTDALCYGDFNGSFELQISGGTPPYSIDTNGIESVDLPAGEYWITVQDSLECVKEMNFIINEPEVLSSSIVVTDITDSTDGGAEIEIGGGTEPYLIEWSTGDSLSEISPLEVGDYWVNITDANGCEISDLFSITGIEGRIDLDQQIEVYPIPFEEKITITLQAANSAQVKVYTADGRLFVTIPIAQGTNHHDTNQWKRGLYIMEIVIAGQRQFIKALKY